MHQIQLYLQKKTFVAQNTNVYDKNTATWDNDR